MVIMLLVNLICPKTPLTGQHAHNRKQGSVAVDAGGALEPMIRGRDKALRRSASDRLRQVFLLGYVLDMSHVLDTSWSHIAV